MASVIVTWNVCFDHISVNSAFWVTTITLCDQTKGLLYKEEISSKREKNSLNFIAKKKKGFIYADWMSWRSREDNQETFHLHSSMRGMRGLGFG
jgi:hypothetical protein